MVIKFSYVDVCFKIILKIIIFEQRSTNVLTRRCVHVPLRHLPEKLRAMLRHQCYYHGDGFEPLWNFCACAS